MEATAGLDGRAGETSPTRRVGRPRSRPAEATDLEPREQILKVAAELFSARGYSATSTRLIADGVGLRQASLFHYFSHKEDILGELLDRTVRPALAFSTWLGGQRFPPEVALHALSWWDVHNLCSRPDNLAGLQLIHEARDERFADFWAARDRLRNRYRSYVEVLGTERSGADPEALETELVFGLVESVLTWFDRHGPATPDNVADAIADGVLGIVGIGPSTIRAIASASRAARDAFPGDPADGAAEGSERRRPREPGHAHGPDDSSR